MITAGVAVWYKVAANLVSRPICFAYKPLYDSQRMIASRISRYDETPSHCVTHLGKFDQEPKCADRATLSDLHF